MADIAARRVSVRAVRKVTYDSGTTTFRVQWRVPGLGDHTKSFRRKPAADRLARQLRTAAEDPRTRWTPSTGLPMALVTRATQTWASYLDEFVARQNGLRPSSVKSLVDGLSIATLVFMGRGGRQPLTVGQGKAVRAWVLDLVSGTGREDARHEEAQKLLRRRSLPMVTIPEGNHIDVLDAALRHTVPEELHLLPPKRVDPRRPDTANELSDRERRQAEIDARPLTDLVGSATVARNTYVRRRNAVSAVFTDAVNRDMWTKSPFARLRARRQGELTVKPKAVLPDHVCDPGQVRLLAHVICLMGRTGGRYLALVYTLGIAGLRPSEAYGLRIRDLVLPDSGWGVAQVRGGTPTPGARYTGSGRPFSDEAIKTAHAGDDELRAVPLAPEVVMALRCHLGQFRADAAGDDRVFTNTKGQPISPQKFELLMRRTRAAVFPPTSPLATLTPYDLRHTAATIMIRAGVSIAEVARRMGHSPSVLLQIYLGVFEDEAAKANQSIDEWLGWRSAGPPVVSPAEAAQWDAAARAS